MKILVADRIAAEGVTALRKQENFEVVEAYGSSPEAMLEKVKDVQAIIVRSETQITREVITAAPLLKAVGRAGVGVDNIDVEAATERGIVVMNTPAGNTIATAELTFTHLLCAARPIAQASHSMREGRWDRKKYVGTELLEKTLGIIGLGRIGTELAKRAQAFGMKVLAYDPYLTKERAKSIRIKKVELEELFGKADYITVHVPRTEKTEGLINSKTIAMMKDGVCLINCARGGIIDQKDLVEAVESGKVRAVGLDVYEKEPLDDNHPLRSYPNIVLTPHLGASTEEAQINVGIEIAKAVGDTLLGKPALNAVNVPAVDEESLEALQPYLKLGRRLGSLLQQISGEAISTLRITYLGKIVDLDTQLLTLNIQCGYLNKISGEDVNIVNAPYLLKNLGIELDSTDSNKDSDYAELIVLQAFTEAGHKSYEVKGTLLGKHHEPRAVCINEQDIELILEGHLLALENRDQPGIVGKVGTILGEEQINIANMVLSRNASGGSALCIFQLDSAPSEKALQRIDEMPEIQSVKKIEL